MAAAPSFVPTAAEIVQLKNELQGSVYKDQDDQIRNTRAVREMSDSVVIQDRYVDTEVRDPTLSDEGFRVAATLSVNPVKHRVPLPVDATPSQQKNATLREDWSESMLEATGRGAMPGFDTRSRIVDMCVNDGAAWAKFLFVKDIWEERYKRRAAGQSDELYNARNDKAVKEAGPPFYFGAVDPLTLYPTYDGPKLSSVLEVQERPMYSTFRKYGLALDGQGKIVPGQVGQQEARSMAGSKVEFLEYTDDTYCLYVVNHGGQAYAAQGDPEKPWKHGYGRVPYFPAFGLMMGHWTNRKVGWGVGETKRWLVQFSSWLMTMLCNVAARDTFTPVIHYINDNAAPLLGPDGSPKKKEIFVAGLREILIAQPGDKYESYPVHDIAEALKMLLALNNEKIDKLLTPRVSSQIGGGLEGAGFAINQVLAEAKISHHPFVEHMEQMYVELTRFAWWLVENRVKEDVYVYSSKNRQYLGLGKKDLLDAVPLSCEIDPERPTAKLIEEQYHEKAVLAQFESKDQAIERQGGKPDEVREGVAIDRMRTQPWYQQWEDDQVRHAMGMGQLAALARQATAVAASGMPPGLGEPPGGVPDMGALAAAPNQAMPDTGGVPGPVAGAPQLQGPPAQSMAPQAQM